MKNIITNLFYVGKDVWLFLYPIAAFYLIGKGKILKRKYIMKL